MEFRRFKDVFRAAVLVGWFGLAGVSSAHEGQQIPSLMVSEAEPREAELPVFTPEEIKSFAAEAVKANQIKDPMQRCLHFPDPPGSHWSRDGIAAYCRYALQSTVSLAEFDRLIQSGKAKTLDQRFASWEADAKNHPEAFYRFLVTTFSDARPEQQVVIESWKQQSPKSAYAYALSAWNFINVGWAARGNASGANTPQSNLDAMQNEMERARGDIEMAIRLSPNLMVDYESMVNIGMAVGDGDYAFQGTKQGLAVPTGKYPLFIRLTKYTSSRWYGSPQSQQKLLAQVDKLAPGEPLLHVIPAIVIANEAGIDYRAPEGGQWSVYRKVLGDVATMGLLSQIGETALNHDQYALAFICLSEAVRSDASNQKLKDQLALATSQMGARLGGN